VGAAAGADILIVSLKSVIPIRPLVRPVRSESSDQRIGRELADPSHSKRFVRGCPPEAARHAQCTVDVIR